MHCCGIPMSNFSYLRLGEENRIPHYHCTKCGHRHHDGIDYTKDEWFFYINEETHYEHRLRMEQEADLLRSSNAHELINHSNPEGELK